MHHQRVAAAAGFPSFSQFDLTGWNLSHPASSSIFGKEAISLLLKPTRLFESGIVIKESRLFHETVCFFLSSNEFHDQICDAYCHRKTPQRVGERLLGFSSPKNIQIMKWSDVSASTQLSQPLSENYLKKYCTMKSFSVPRFRIWLQRRGSRFRIG